jgi:Silencing defective 2 N-terminal ubiquitin domain
MIPTMSKEHQWLVRFQNVTHVLNVSCRDDSSVVNALLNMLSLRTGWPASRMQIIDAPQYPFASVTVISCLKGGKGGFGTLLKGQSKQAGAKRTTDFGACRDLQGRRLRHVNDEIKLRKWRELQRRKQEGISGGEEDMWQTPSGLVRN